MMAFGGSAESGGSGTSCLNLRLSAGWRGSVGKALGPPERRNKPRGFLLTFLMLEGEGGGYTAARWAGDMLLLM